MLQRQQRISDSLTVSGNAAITLGNVNNNDRLKTVAVSTTAGDVAVGDILAGAVADVTGAQISVSTASGTAVLGNVSIEGATGTVSSQIQSISVSGTQDTGAAPTSIGNVTADALGTLSISSTTGAVQVGNLVVGNDTLTTVVDGTIGSVSAVGATAVTVGTINADRVGNITLSSTNAATPAGMASVTLTAIGGHSSGTPPTIPLSPSVGNVSLSSAAGMVTTGQIDASGLGDLTVNAKTTAMLGTISVLNAAGTAQTGLLSVIAGTSATLSDIFLDRSGNVSVRTLGGNLTHGEIEFEDTAARTVAFDAVGNIVSNTGKAIENIGGDLTLTAKASGAFSAGGTTVSVGVMTPPPSQPLDLDLIADFSQVVGNVGAMAMPVTLRNYGIDDAASVNATGGRADNFITIDARGGTVTYQGQNGVDVITLAATGTYKTSQINTEGGNDVIVGGAGNDVINAGAGADMITGGAGADVIILADGSVAATDTVFFAATAASNGQDTITGFTFAAPASGGDILNVSTFLGAPVDANNGMSTLGVSIATLNNNFQASGGTNTANVGQLNDIQMLTAANFGATPSSTVIQTAANGRFFVIADVAGDSDAIQNLYFVTTDATNIATVTLVGTLNEGTLIAANLA